MTNNKQQTEMNVVEYLDKVNQFAKENNTGKPRQQTAVEWLEDTLTGFLCFENMEAVNNFDKLLEQAKEMEKQQLIDAFVECWKENMPDGYECKQSAEQYYNETYK